MCGGGLGWAYKTSSRDDRCILGVVSRKKSARARIVPTVAIWLVDDRPVSRVPLFCYFLQRVTLIFISQSIKYVCVYLNLCLFVFLPLACNSFTNNIIFIRISLQ